MKPRYIVCSSALLNRVIRLRISTLLGRWCIGCRSPHSSASDSECMARSFKQSAVISKTDASVRRRNFIHSQANTRRRRLGNYSGFLIRLRKRKLLRRAQQIAIAIAQLRVCITLGQVQCISAAFSRSTQRALLPERPDCSLPLLPHLLEPVDLPLPIAFIMNAIAAVLFLVQLLLKRDLT